MDSKISRVLRLRTLAVIVAVGLAAGLGYVASRVVSAQQTQQAQLPSPGDLSRAFINVAKQVKPAVVNIDVVEKARRSSLRVPEGFPQIPGFPPFGEQGPRRQRGTGSGVIVSADGYILTNNHVAADADEITVKLADGREFKARRIGTDAETDLAVIKIEADNLPFARLGDSNSLEQGEWVIALGSPFGLQQTMTAGIVSAIGRDLRLGTYDNYIQTDASINPGNSGGPLVNMKGEVVGINNMIFSHTGGSEGIGFAIPSNLATKVYAQLVKSGKVTRGYLGVRLMDVTPALAKAVGYKGDDGALVSDLAPGEGPAAQAGLRSGDVITEFDGKPIKTAKQLTEMVADLPVGKAAAVKYVRDGRAATTTIHLGERPRPNDADQEESESEVEGAGKLGLVRVQTVTPQTARELKLKIPSGALIQGVQPGSPAAEAGLREGDVIHRLNRADVTTAQSLGEALRSLKGEKEIVLQIERAGQLSFVTVTLD
ncbi:MAG TPA: DegQ family serine endoprotease [Blastocatellia bacterium]|nr:DegQ family serine endoprotease [Blastocatellia bacterium]